VSEPAFRLAGERRARRHHTWQLAFRTSLTRTDGIVRVVEDRSRAWPERHHARPSDQDGRGMAIVAALSQRSGCESTPGGKVAWAELNI
jgi:hypothetical protein